MKILPLLFLSCVVFGGGCAKLAHLQELLTLKGFSSERDRQDLYVEKQNKNFDVFNVGSEQKLSVDSVANRVCANLKVSPKFTYTGNDRGWAGDVRKMQLDISKIKSLGWKEEIGFNKGLELYLKWIEKF